MVSGGELGGQDVQLLDRRLAEQFAGLLAESGRNCAGQVRVAAGVVGEHVEDPEGGRAETDREPRDGGRLLLGEASPDAEEFLDLVFLAGQGLQPDKQSLRHAHAITSSWVELLAHYAPIVAQITGRSPGERLVIRFPGRRRQHRRHAGPCGRSEGRQGATFDHT
ncbi:hypothetical protein STAWA0001_0340, partial [Staphylococcus warneri L37603]